MANTAIMRHAHRDPAALDPAFSELRTNQMRSPLRPQRAVFP